VPAEEPVTPELLGELIAAGNPLRWNEGSRFAYHDFEDETALFVDGEQFLLRGDARPLAPLLCASARPDMGALASFAGDDAIQGLLSTLVNQGSLYFD
jgi:50S ribosomal protein L16 3-hydroxylase